MPAPAYVLEALSEHLRRYGVGERELLFCGARGGPLSVSMVSGPLRVACQKAGLPEEVTFHTLRHSYASEMLVQGLSVVEVAELIGDTVAMVEKTYGHPTVDFRKRARLAVESRPSTRSRTLGESVLHMAEPNHRPGGRSSLRGTRSPRGWPSGLA